MPLLISLVIGLIAAGLGLAAIIRFVIQDIAIRRMRRAIEHRATHSRQARRD